MKKSYIKSAIAATALMLGAAGSANAFTITAGDITFIIGAFDSASSGYIGSGTVCTTVLGCDAAAGSKAPGSIGSFDPSADTMGIFQVLQIRNLTTNTVLFATGTDGYLSGIFGRLEDTNVTITGTKTVALATSGIMSLYLSTTNTYSAAPGPLVSGVTDLNNNMYPGINPNPGATLYLQGNFVPGINGEAVTTYMSDFNSNSLTGSGGGYIKLTGGSALGQFDTDAYDIGGNGADMLMKNDFSVAKLGEPNGWTVHSSGHVDASAIPEPGSVALLSIGALFAGLLGRRRKKVVAA
jgi:hypothetical protein